MKMPEVTEIEIKGGRAVNKRKYELSHSDGNHQYRVRDIDKKGKTGKSRTVPSVTGITGMLDKPGLVFWSARLTADYIMKHMITKDGKLKPGAELNADIIFTKAKKEHSEVLSKAGNLGTDVHRYIDRFLTTGKRPGKSKKVTKQILQAFKNFEVWWKKHGQEVIATEMRIYNPAFEYTGTLDICATILDDKGVSGKYIIDIKTSNAFHAPEMPMQLAAYAEAYELLTGTTIDGIGIIRLEKETGEFHWMDYTFCRVEAFEMFRRLREVKALMKLVK